MRKIILKSYRVGKYKFDVRNVFGWSIDVYRNGSQFVLIQLREIFSKRFLILCYRNNISFRRHNKDLPKWMFPKWQLANNWKEELSKYLKVNKSEKTQFIGDLESGI